uniref:Uncharacterized protein n=1 Tax=Fagus sylvatica TaxID=28930 RepID=A0A2N9IDQ0_FAGSY
MVEGLVQNWTGGDQMVESWTGGDQRERTPGGDQNRGETERGGLVQNCKEEIRLGIIENPKIKTQKVFRPDYSYLPEQVGTGRNGPKRAKRPEYEPRWNRGVTRTGLHTGTRFSVRSGRNGTDYTTLVFSGSFGSSPSYIKPFHARVDFLPPIVGKQLEPGGPNVAIRLSRKASRTRSIWKGCGCGQPK